MKRIVEREPRVGDQRIRTGFLWLPMSLYYGIREEWRWLEKAQWKEEYREYGTDADSRFDWHPLLWVNE